MNPTARQEAIKFFNDSMGDKTRSFVFISIDDMGGFKILTSGPENDLAFANSLLTKVIHEKIPMRVESK